MMGVSALMQVMSMEWARSRAPANFVSAVLESVFVTPKCCVPTGPGRD